MNVFPEPRLQEEHVSVPCSEGQSMEVSSPLGDLGEVRDGRNGCISADPDVVCFIHSGLIYFPVLLVQSKLYPPT